VIDTTQLAADAVTDAKINWSTAGSAPEAGEVSAADIPMEDSAGYFDTDYVEDALADLASMSFVLVEAGIGLSSGDAVYIKYDVDKEKAYKALADSADNCFVVGFALNDVSLGETVKIQLLGKFSDSNYNFGTADRNKPIYLDPTTAGGITITAPSTDGQFIYKLGRVIGQTSIIIDKATPIQL